MEKSKIKIKNINDVKLIDLPCHVSHGKLVVAEVGKEIQNEIRRVFVINGKAGEHRGSHAHRELMQILVCVHGACRVSCDDGKHKKSILLDKSETALIIPPGIWAEQTYLSEDTVLMVMCDLPYDETDYIRDYDTFKIYREGMIN